MNETKYKKNLEQIVSEELQSLNIPGAALAVVYEDKLAFAEGFGIASSETGALLVPEMLLRIGSVTKVITAYTLISLVEEQQRSCHTPIATYVPDLPMCVGQLTIHQLLCHTSGLKDDFSHYGSHDEAALGRAVRGYGAQHFIASPDHVFSYSSLGYAVAGVVIEALSHQPYAQAVQERVLAPLGMERSTFYPTVAMTYPLSQGHEATGPHQWNVVRPYDDTAERWPSGFLFSNVLEFSRFTRAFMNQGQLEGKQVLSSEVISILQEPHAKMLEADTSSYYGYGLFLSSNRGERQVTFGGGRKGFSSHVRLIPRHRFAIIQLLNRGGVQLRKTPEKAMELFLPYDAQPAALPASDIPLTLMEIQRLAGRYARPDLHATPTDILQLVHRESELLFQTSRNQLFPIIKIDEKRFAVQFGQELPPFIFAFQKGANEEEDYVCCMHRAYKRVSESS